MNKMDRAEMVKSMDYIVGKINDMAITPSWLVYGVADGDIDSETTLDDIVEMGYCEDQTFSELMTLFLKLMYRAGASGGLYCDDIVSCERHIEWR